MAYNNKYIDGLVEDCKKDISQGNNISAQCPSAHGNKTSFILWTIRLLLKTMKKRYNRKCIPHVLSPSYI